MAPKKSEFLKSNLRLPEGTFDLTNATDLGMTVQEMRTMIGLCLNDVSDSVTPM